MNVVFLSPHFPPNQYLYCARLRELGIKTLGIVDRGWEGLAPWQRHALDDHYSVLDLEDYDAVREGVAHFIRVHGTIDRVESHNEHWLPHEARLRLDFKIRGARPEDLEIARRKSRMKKVFRDAGLEVARGAAAESLEAAIDFAREAGYPIVLKPDVGVGAAGTYRIEDSRQLRAFFEEKKSVPYFMEEFIQGSIRTFDGLADCEGRILCFFSMEYSRGVMEVVNEDTDIYYFTHREIPSDLIAAGTRAVRAFGIHGGFFHLEFFCTENARFIALEANLRPPGGYSVDMFNYSCDNDLYAAWARVVAGKPPASDWHRRYHCCFINRKFRYAYRRAHEEVLRLGGDRIVFHTPMPGAFRAAMGDYAYLVRTETLEELWPIVELIQSKA